MQVTGGQYRGQKIELLKDVRGEIRPTLAKVRESVFNVLLSEFQDVQGLKFLDMFSGSGVMAIEAVSRGYDVTAIEKDYLASKTLKANCEKLEAPVKIIVSDALRVISKLEYFEIIYIDPPWDYEYGPIVECAASKLNKNGVIVCESDVKIKPTLEGIPSSVRLFKEKHYGRCKLSFFELSKIGKE